MDLYTILFNSHLEVSRTMTMMANIVTILGIMLLYIGILTGGKGRTSLLIFFVGGVYLYSGLFIIVDPPLDLVTLSSLFSIVIGIWVFAKAGMWAISKTNLYQNVNNALLSIPKINSNIADFKEKWEKEHDISD